MTVTATTAAVPAAVAAMPSPAALREAVRTAALASLFLAVLLGGCAAPQSAALRRDLEAPRALQAAEASVAGRAVDVQALPARAMLADVPFVAQTEYECGPASLAMTLGAAGRTVALPSLIEAVYLPERRGSLQAEMLAAPRREGMLSVAMPARLESLLREVAAGTPVLVLQNLGLAWAPVWHYAVLIGYDLPRSQVVLHSGVHESMPMSIDTFERTWVRAGSWAMVVTPPARLPFAPTPMQTLRAAAALERIDRMAAMASYDALRARAPGDRLVLFARANALLADSRAEAAASAYRELLALHPDYADAWNNLAHALSDAGDRIGAREAADRAVAIGGPSADVYRQTAARMHAKVGKPTQ